MLTVAPLATTGYSFSYHVNPFVSLAIAVVCAVACYFLAVRKARRGPLWAVLGFFFGIISLIVIACLPSKAAATPARY